MEQTKKCSKCGEVKGVDSFYKRKSINGLNSQCKKCKGEVQKKYAINNKQKINDYKRKWVNDNIKKVNDSQVKYRNNNIDIIRKRKRDWSRNNPKKNKIRTIELHDTYIINVLVINLKRPYSSIKNNHELIELKRNQLKLHRTIKQKENEQNSKYNSR